MNEYYRGYYSTISIEYDSLTEKRYHAILDRIEQIRPVGRLLDIGCGAGHFLAVAERRVWQTVGLEVSKSALEFLRQVRKDREWKLLVVGGDLERSGFSPKSFDAVTLFEVIEHVSNPVASLEEIYRLLADGGVVYMTTPNFDSLSRYILGCKWRVVAEEHQCLFNVETLRGCLVGVGFRPLAIRTKNVNVLEIFANW